MARKSTIAFEAEPEWSIELRASSLMALRPKGVAALPIPRIFDAMFMIIAPIAGWSAGIVGEQPAGQSGSACVAITSRRPASKAIRIRPRKKTMTPTRPMTSWTADLCADEDRVDHSLRRSPCPPSADERTGQRKDQPDGIEHGTPRSPYIKGAIPSRPPASAAIAPGAGSPITSSGVKRSRRSPRCKCPCSESRMLGEGVAVYWVIRSERRPFGAWSRLACEGSAFWFESASRPPERVAERAVHASAACATSRAPTLDGRLDDLQAGSAGRGESSAFYVVRALATARSIYCAGRRSPADSRLEPEDPDCTGSARSLRSDPSFLDADLGPTAARRERARVAPGRRAVEIRS